MRLQRSSVLAGTGRLTGAVMRADGVDFFIDTGCAIAKRHMPIGRRGIAQEQTVSYADDYTEAGGFSISRKAGKIQIAEREQG